jgi:hypothetical protein
MPAPEVRNGAGWGEGDGFMHDALRRVGRDLKHRRNIEAYAVAGLAIVFAVLSVIGDVVPVNLRWAALFAGLALLVYRLTLPDQAGTAGELLRDRTSFDDRPFTALLDHAHEVWIFAPSAVNLLTQRNCDALRAKVLNRANGTVRIVVLDPHQPDALRLATKQLDDSLDYPMQQLEPSLATTLQQLRSMNSWTVSGSLEHRLLDYNPGFSLVAIDPSERHGILIVEFHAFHNESTTSRMHIELRRSDSQHWYTYWIDQFDHIWHAATPPSTQRHAG